MKPSLLLLPLLLAPLTALAEPGWGGSGELGLAVARGNAHAENFNAKLAVVNESDAWTYKAGLSAVRARSRVDVVDEDGLGGSRYELSANRYQANASAAYNMNPRASWVSALRHERDDFAAYEQQTTFSLGYGYRYLDTEHVRLATELGPGYRRARRASDGEVENDLILRGLLEYRHQVTDTTTLTNTLLVESGDDNTFAQNDFGVAVAINSQLALKAGLQLRHNTEVDPGKRKTDTLTTVNLVYTLGKP